MLERYCKQKLPRQIWCRLEYTSLATTKETMTIRAAIKLPTMAPVFAEEAVETKQGDRKELRSRERVEQQVKQHSREIESIPAAPGY